jgi:hypothetical protein
MSRFLSRRRVNESRFAGRCHQSSSRLLRRSWCADAKPWIRHLRRSGDGARRPSARARWAHFSCALALERVVTYSYIAVHIRKHVHMRETVSCRCGGHVVTAPERWSDTTRYDASFVAHVVVSKCLMSTPLYRLEADFKRLGIPIFRTTLNDFSAAARRSSCNFESRFSRESVRMISCMQTRRRSS